MCSFHLEKAKRNVFKQVEKVGKAYSVKCIAGFLSSRVRFWSVLYQNKSLLPCWSFMLLQNVSYPGFMSLYLDPKWEISFSAMGTSSEYIILFHCNSCYNKQQ